MFHIRNKYTKINQNEVMREYTDNFICLLNNVLTAPPLDWMGLRFSRTFLLNAHSIF